MDREKIIEMLDNRINNRFDYNNPAVLDKYWEDLAAEFNGTEDEIIEFLGSMDDKHLDWATEVFDDIYDILGESDSFFDKLEKLQIERPNIDFGFR
ncbi:MAG: hypothetical protein ACI4VF_08525 [Lachnospirales bacterium]